MEKKQYEQRINKISVRARDDHNEYHRQYYWIVKRGFEKAPEKQEGIGRPKKEVINSE